MSARSTAPHLSLVVCTRDRPAALDKCLASVEQAAARDAQIDFELLVVDNSAHATARDIIGKWQPRFSNRLVGLRETDPGLSRARNMALSEVRGRIIAFTDDDCRVETDFFRGVLRAHWEAGTPCVIGGRVMRGSEADLDFTTRYGKQTEYFTTETVPGGFVLGCNLSMDRHVVEKVGLFDVLFGAGGRFHSAEDTDYVIRANVAHIPVLYSPLFTVRHYHGRTTREAILSLHKGYSFGNGALYAKFWRDAPWLRRQLLWMVKGCLREAFRGRRFDEVNTLSHYPILLSNIAGMLGYRFVRTVKSDQPGLSSRNDLQ